ncbi:MAG TPA: ribokinase [Anaerolineae bacterium]|nr:ribokinase [Anaerolineae bacterium]HID85195.1 ribokinase [Anaerolineales bacterium]HIQ08354.1 ribokinase [Anaerolineaceae bacterium]
MTTLRYNPVDYLVVGHLTKDLTLSGPRLGGTAAYAALTARALGLRVGIVTAWAGDLDASPLAGIPLAGPPSEVTTTFENRETPQGRQQTLHALAPSLALYHTPEPWRRAPIAHIGPVAQEVEPNVLPGLHASLLGITPQGWLRQWDAQGQVHPGEWPEGSVVLRQAHAAVLSIEDLGGHEERIPELASACRVLVITRGAQGADLYWQGEVHHFDAPQVPERDATGAGDIFAAAFFVRLYQTRDPLEAARFATLLAADSVTRVGLDGVPSMERIFTLLRH